VGGGRRVDAIAVGGKMTTKNKPLPISSGTRKRENQRRKREEIV